MTAVQPCPGLPSCEHDDGDVFRGNTEKLLLRLGDVVDRTWDLGMTAFGGPPVHIRILHQRFVECKSGKTPWADEDAVS